MIIYTEKLASHCLQISDTVFIQYMQRNANIWYSYKEQLTASWLDSLWEWPQSPNISTPRPP